MVEEQKAAGQETTQQAPKPAENTKNPAEKDKILQKFSNELLIAGYSERTLTMYCCYVDEFLSSLQKPVVETCHDDVVSFLVKKKTDGLSNTSLALIYSSLSFLFKNILKLKIMEEVKRPKIGKKIPTILTKEEVSTLLNAATKKRDKLMLSFLYSTGCRVSECTKIKIEDIDFNNYTAMVRGGKGNKDRAIILSKRWVEEIKKYLKGRELKTGFVFAKKSGGKISEDTIQKITKACAKKAGILKKVTPHVLRHSYATHLLEAGESIRKIQVLLGHANLSTTQIYTTISTDELKKVKSPLDGL